MTCSRSTHVAVVAGPSCVGKTTLCHKLLKGELPSLAAALDLSPDSLPVVVPAIDRGRMPTRWPDALPSWPHASPSTEGADGAARTDAALGMASRGPSPAE